MNRTFDQQNIIPVLAKTKSNESMKDETEGEDSSRTPANTDIFAGRYKKLKRFGHSQKIYKMVYLAMDLLTD